MRPGKLLCFVGLHRWRLVRVLTDVKLLGGTWPDAHLSIKVNAADFVDECSRCPRRRDVSDV